MQNDTIQIFNQLLGQYNGSIPHLLTGSIAIAKEIFSAVALISIGIFGFNQLLRKNSDMADTNLELVKWLIYLITLYTFIDHFQDIFNTLYNWIEDIASYLGVQVAQPDVNTSSTGTVAIKPENVFAIGVSVAKSILTVNYNLNLGRDFYMALVSVISASVVLFCFATIGLELILVQIGSKIILAGGIFLLAFGGLQWTKEYAERYVHTFFHVGIKMIFIYVLIGLGISLSKSWSNTLKTVSDAQLIDYYMSVVLSSYVFYKLCLKLPDQAVSFLTGRLSIGYDTAADVGAAVKAPGKIIKGGMSIAKGISGVPKEIAGISRAVNAAGQMAKTTLESQGIKGNKWNTTSGAIKTLGSAWKKETWDKKVGETTGGKMAKEILGDMSKIEPLDFSI